MKTENASQAGVVLNQRKVIREDKVTNRREPNRTMGDKVDLSTKGLSAMSTPVPAYGEVLQLLKGIDFRQARDTDWISTEAKGKLMELLQS